MNNIASRDAKVWIMEIQNNLQWGLFFVQLKFTHYSIAVDRKLIKNLV